MLVLSRKPGEKIMLGNDITLTVVEIVGNRVRLAIQAPDDVRILRGELVFWQEEDGQNPRRPLRKAPKDNGPEPDIIAMA